jgi:predicted short-subunit dehydrogenase-like oxidoreductase (DUF2520 family)
MFFQGFIRLEWRHSGSPSRAALRAGAQPYSDNQGCFLGSSTSHRRAAPMTVSISIIGPGKVGTALGILAAKSGYRVCAVGARALMRGQAAAARIPGDVISCSPKEAASLGNLVFLTVSDDQIQPLCDSLASDKAFFPGAVVVHCSGALPSSVLQSAREQTRCVIASAHPLQTFPSVEAALDRLAGTFFFCDGDPQALSVLQEFVPGIGGIFSRVKPEGKALYHAAAVFACNYLASLMDAALSCAEHAGIARDVAWTALEPLVQATLTNISHVGTAKALTGPIARGDADTLMRHMIAFRSQNLEPLSDLYSALASWTIAIAVQNGTLSREQAERLGAAAACDPAVRLS